MKKFTVFACFILISILLSSCCTVKRLESGDAMDSISSLRFVGEIVIPTNKKFRNTVIGGLSGIDYANGKYYVISDDKNKPVRFYTMDLDYSENGVSDFDITDMTIIHTKDEFVDPESIRFDQSGHHFFWSSEGAVRFGVSPSVSEIDTNGLLIKKYPTPKIFTVTDDKSIGPRQNGTFEGLSMSTDPDYYWVGMELPLKQDGEEPKLIKTDSPVRISKIDKKTGEIVYQFAYYLDPIPKDSRPKGKFRVNGLPEIYSVDDKTFLFVERAYASGYSNGGNTVKIYKVETSGATDVKNYSSLKKNNFVPAKKTLLFDFESVRSKLTKGIVDNIEGICEGKTLPNGHKTLVLISDDNFSKFNPQLNQIIVLEIIP